MQILEAHNITKIFPGVIALNDVSIFFNTKKIHGIIGENGAGKSTLVKILTGIYKADKGKIFIEGNEVSDHQSELFEKVTFVPQELNLFQNMTVAENLFIPFRRSGFKGSLVSMKKLYNAAIPWLDKFKINVKPNVNVNDISVSNQQLLQIARALVNKYAEILILDEPTTSLTSKDTLRLFKIIRDLKSENKAIIFISHKLDEIFELCDEITVLRNGKKVGSSNDIKKINNKWIISKMSARDIDQEYNYRPVGIEKEKIMLEVDNLSGLRFSNISFKLHKGEILGFAGLVGAGRSEIMQTIFGYLTVGSGQIKLEGKPWKFGSPSYSVKKGLFYLPEDRKTQGILPYLSVKNNIGISLLKDTSNGIIVSDGKEATLAKNVILAYNISTPTLDQQIMFLSGGNQQKVIIGRTMFCTPKVLIFDEPTKGIDVGTKNDLYKIMKDIAEKQGVSIIFISSELDELIRCSNRIITIYQGKKADEFETETSNSNKNNILSSMFGEKLNKKYVENIS
jgi:ABC-type sugar transport system ATPase subunit